VLDRVYLGWYPVLITANLAAILFARPVLRLQYLLSLLLMWAIAGTALALAFPSGGPVYYQAFTGEPGTFSPLLADLAQSGTWAHGVQSRLWALHVAGSEIPFSGISAMPSVHVGGATLIARSASG
jgi:hypothetical protein